MKKIAVFILLLCIALTVAACNDQENTTTESATETETAEAVVESTTETETESAVETETETESETESATESETESETESTEANITLQEVYDAGKDLAALLGDHDNVYIQVASNDTVLYEMYLTDRYYYSAYDAEYMGVGYASFATNTAEYFYMDGVYALDVTITPDGVVTKTDLLSEVGEDIFVSDAMLNDSFTITEENGSIIVTTVADLDEIWTDEGVVSCVEIYTLDAETREMISVQTIYTFEDGTTEEGTAIITRDVEAPEGVEAFLAYAEAESLRTVTIISNPGADNEKTDVIQAPQGLEVSILPDWDFFEEPVAVYTDADCTQFFEGDLDVNADLTLYVKWGE